MIFKDRYAGKRAVITGGAAGIGKTIAVRLAAEGAKVIAWDRDETALAEMEKLGIGGHALDVADEAAGKAAAKASAEKLGGIDGLGCSAGNTGPNTTVADYPPAEWRRVFDINVHGVFYCNQACVPVMLDGGYGRIVNIASIAGKEGNPNASGYSASKAAVIGLTKSLGKELAKTPVTVNCVTPAAVRTAIFDQMTEEFIAFMLSKIPVGRFGTVDEVTSLVLWLASEECSFSTGAVFDVSGGRATY